MDLASPAVSGTSVYANGLIYLAVSNSHNLHSTVIEKLKKYTDLKEELTRI